jgi:hypothetical protein
MIAYRISEIDGGLTKLFNDVHHIYFLSCNFCLSNVDSDANYISGDIFYLIGAYICAVCA